MQELCHTIKTRTYIIVDTISPTFDSWSDGSLDDSVNVEYGSFYDLPTALFNDNSVAEPFTVTGVDAGTGYDYIFTRTLPVISKYTMKYRAVNIILSISW